MNTMRLLFEMDVARLLIEILQALFAFAAAVGIYIIGGGYLAREKYKLLSEFWFHISIILDAAILYTNTGGRSPEEDRLKRFHEARTDHQNHAADYLNKLEIIISEDMFNKTKDVFKIFHRIDYYDAIRKQTEETEDRNRFYEYNEEIRTYRTDLSRMIKAEFRKPKYWLLK